MNALVKVSDSLAAANADQEIQQYLTFMLGGEVFAIGILHIKEIIEYGQLTTVPMMPPFIRGVINLRGAVVPVVDLASRFGGKPARSPGVAASSFWSWKPRKPPGDRRGGRCSERGAGDRRRGHRAAAQIRHQDPYRLHRRHGQGAGTLSSSSSTSTRCCRRPGNILARSFESTGFRRSPEWQDANESVFPQ
jgi:hypothetical protein